MNHKDHENRPENRNPHRGYLQKDRVEGETFFDLHADGGARLHNVNDPEYLGTSIPPAIRIFQSPTAPITFF